MKNQNKTLEHSTSLIISKAIIIIALLFIFSVSLFIQNETYDAYEYLLGAKSLVLGKIDWYNFIRPFGVSWLAFPFTFIFPDVEQSYFLFRILHLQWFFITLFYFFIAYKIFSWESNNSYALIPLALLLSSRLVIRYGWSVLSDIPAALLIAICFLIIINNGNNVNIFIIGLLLGLAANFKIYLILMLFPIMFSIWIVNKNEISIKIFIKLIIVAFSSIIFFLFIQIFSAYYLTGGQFISYDNWMKFFKLLLNIGGVKNNILYEGEHFWEYFYFFIKISGYLSLPFFILGVFLNVKNFKKNNLILLIWLTSNLLFLICSSHKEARYLFPLLIPFYWFVSEGIIFMFYLLRNKVQNKLIRILLHSLIFLSFIIPMLKEFYAFSSTSLYKPIQQGFSKELNAESNNYENLYFFGYHYPLFLFKGDFSKYDEFYYIYHYGQNAFTYWTHKKPLNIEVQSHTQRNGFPVGFYPEKNSLIILNPSDLQINSMNLELWIKSKKTLNLVEIKKTEYPAIELEDKFIYMTNNGEIIAEIIKHENLFITKKENINEWFGDYGSNKILNLKNSLHKETIKLNSIPKKIIGIEYKVVKEYCPA
ncbi:MAG: hypothetical protein ACD_79C00643G0005 [uncultured bacterium]|nr:MAG: hypothetical protein ACD_79C00643G0005 [uncultured bacterium]